MITLFAVKGRPRAAAVSRQDAQAELSSFTEAPESALRPWQLQV